MENTKYVLKIREVNRDIFEAIRTGKKKVETRAGSPKYFNIKARDTLVFMCGKDKFEKNAGKIRKFKNIRSLLKAYNPQDINPKIRNLEESERMCYSFPGYKEKIKKYGLIAIEL